MRNVIKTSKAPATIGSYSQAVRGTGEVVYLAGQIPLDPVTMEIVGGGVEAEVKQVFENIKNVVLAAGGNLDQVVKLTVYLMDLAGVKAVNEGIAAYFNEPFPARTTIQVAGLPKGALVEIEAVMMV